MTLLQGPTNQTKHDMISPKILKAGGHLLERRDALVVQQNRLARWKKGNATFDIRIKNCPPDNLFSGAKHIVIPKTIAADPVGG